MIRYSLRKTQTKACVIISLLLTLALSLGGCSSDSYDTPKTADNAPVPGAATSVLIEPVTLKGWMDQGLVNSDSTFDTNVVILDFGSSSNTRIKGACRVAKAELDALRFEGVADAFPLAPPGAQMDALIQKLGINENSTIVFTADSAMFATRAYWVFRYWGFPKERLKFLNGVNGAFATAYPDLMTTEAPTPVASTYSVKDLPSFNADLRASVGEMITIISDLPLSTTNLVLDARGVDPSVGKSGYYGTSPTSGQITGEVVLFDGHPEGGQYLNQSTLFESGKFKAVTDIETLFKAKGWTDDKKTTVYCTTGYSATPLFFALDALLGADAQLYDGSWSQLGKYSDFQTLGGELPYGSPWAADKYLDISEGAYSYNIDIPGNLTIESLQIDAEAAAPATPFTADTPADDSDVDPAANQVEVADAAYAAGPATVTFATPVLTATDAVLISADTLAGWMNDGLVNKAAGSERVVLLDVTSATNYEKAHIPGAQLWDTSKHVMTRVEGPATKAVNMVLDGAGMDAMIKAAGIDENTTIVITSSQTTSFYASRAYFLFRYWGFPKERIKVLNGYNGAWPAADLTEVATNLPASTLSVAALANHQPNLRVSLAELMDAVRDGRGTAVDMRGDSSATKSTTGVFPNATGVSVDYVVFEGTIKGGKFFNYTRFNVDATAGDLRFRSKDAIEAMLIEDDIVPSTDGSNTIYSYCRTGYIASTGFFVLDAILGADVMTYDGSWSQWGQMSDNAVKKGELTTGSLWAVDNATYMDVVNYNADHIKVVEKLNPDGEALDLLPSSADANQVENADELYRTPTSGGTGGSAPDQFTPVGGGC